MLKRKLWLIAGIFMTAILILVGCPDDSGGGGGGTQTTPIAVTSVTITPTGGKPVGSSILIWEATDEDPEHPTSMTVSATVLPANATNKTVAWTTDTDDFIDFDEETGAITPIAPGTTVITATAGSHSDSLTVIVMEEGSEYVLVEGVSIDGEDFELEVGKTKTLTAIVTPAEATDQTVTWASSDEDVATVDHDGVVTAVAEGEALITATTNGVNEEDEKVTSAPITVRVTEEGEEEDLGAPFIVTLYNQKAASLDDKTTTTMPEKDEKGRFTIVNNESDASFENVLTVGRTQNATIVYWPDPFYDSGFISARVRMTSVSGNGATKGIIMGVIEDPEAGNDAGDIKFQGIRLTGNNIPARYVTRNPDLPTQGGDYSGNAFPAIPNQLVDDEFILEVNWAGANYTMNIKDAAGAAVLSTHAIGSSQNAVGFDEGAYLGFIIADATLEISQVVIKKGLSVVSGSGSCAPTVFGVERVEFTAPNVGGSDGDFTYTHSTLSGYALGISAAALPLRAVDKTISWEIEAGTTGGTLNKTTGEDVTVTFTGDGEAVVTATAGDISSTLTITVNSLAVLVNTITISAPHNWVMAGDGASNAGGTLQFTEVVLPTDADDSTVTWTVWDDAAGTTAATNATIDADTGLLTATSTAITNSAYVWVIAEANDASGAKSTAMRIKVSPYINGHFWDFSDKIWPWYGDTAQSYTHFIGTATGAVGGTVDGLTFIGNQGWGIQASPTSYTVGDETFTHRLSTNGGGTMSTTAGSRLITFDVTGPCTVKVYVNQQAVARIVTLSNMATGSPVDTGTGLAASTDGTYTISYTGGVATLALWNDTGANHFYGIKVIYP